MRPAVERPVLRPAPIGALGPLEVGEGSQGGLRLAGVEEPGRGVDQIAWPDQVVDVIAIPAGLAPGRRGGGDKRPWGALVLEAAQHRQAGAGQLTAVT